MKYEFSTTKSVLLEKKDELESLRKKYRPYDE